MFSLKRDTFETKTKYQKTIQRVDSFMTKYKKKREAKIKEVLKFEVSINDIDFFDFTLQMNMFKLRLTTLSASFSQQLKNSTIKYQKQSILNVLDKCLRDLVYK